MNEWSVIVVVVLALVVVVVVVVVLSSASLRGLEGLEKLEYLDLRGNRIRSVRDLEAFLPGLVTLLLTGNPVTASLDYPQEIFHLFPSLQKLDTW